MTHNEIVSTHLSERLEAGDLPSDVVANIEKEYGLENPLVLYSVFECAFPSLPLTRKLFIAYKAGLIDDARFNRIVLPLIAGLKNTEDPT